MESLKDLSATIPPREIKYSFLGRMHHLPNASWVLRLAGYGGPEPRGGILHHELDAPQLLSRRISEMQASRSLRPDMQIA